MCVLIDQVMLSRSQVGSQMLQCEKNVQSDQDSNPGPFAYWASALPTELLAAYLFSTHNCD